jgi:DNA-binding MarR family transcriptional regulator
MRRNGSSSISPAGGSVAYHNEILWSRSGFLARRLHQIHVALFLDAFADIGLTPIQWGLMTVVAGQPGMNFNEIALEVGIDRSNAADVCMRLSEKGILSLSASKADRRMKCVFITKKGARLLKQHEHLVATCQEQLLDPLSKTERKIFLAMLRRIVDHNNDASRAPLRSGDANVA